jgi:hypothetical protein
VSLEDGREVLVLHDSQEHVVFSSGIAQSRVVFEKLKSGDSEDLPAAEIGAISGVDEKAAVDAASFCSGFQDSPISRWIDVFPSKDQSDPEVQSLYQQIYVCARISAAVEKSDAWAVSQLPTDHLLNTIARQNFASHGGSEELTFTCEP